MEAGAYTTRLQHTPETLSSSDELLKFEDLDPEIGARGEERVVILDAVLVLLHQRVQEELLPIHRERPVVGERPRDALVLRVGEAEPQHHHAVLILADEPGDLLRRVRLLAAPLDVAALARTRNREVGLGLEDRLAVLTGLRLVVLERPISRGVHEAIRARVPHLDLPLPRRVDRGPPGSRIRLAQD